MKPVNGVRYVAADGTLTLDGMRLFGAMADDLEAARQIIADAAAVPAPTGGATVDAEARAAVAAILGALG